MGDEAFNCAAPSFPLPLNLAKLRCSGVVLLHPSHFLWVFEQQDSVKGASAELENGNLLPAARRAEDA